MLLAFCSLACVIGCGPKAREPEVEPADQTQILHKGNGQEPESLDPHIVNSIPSYNVILALLEGLVAEDPKTLEPVPGVAESWTFSEDGKTVTFKLRANAKWSTGDPVTAQDFVFSYQRILTPSLGCGYAYMLDVLVKAEAFRKGEVTDFGEVGVKAVDDRTLVLTLNHPTPHLLNLMNHWTWFPVHPPTILQHGKIGERATGWSKSGHFVGNGPFNLASWVLNDKLVVTKSPTYWDAETVQLEEIHFYPTGDVPAEERGYRAGNLHITYQLPLSKIEVYQKKDPEVLRIHTYLSTYFYCFNVNQPPLDDVRVRKALAFAIHRQQICSRIRRGGQKPAFHFTPPDTAGYTARTQFEPSVQKARELLAEAGFPKGEGFPKLELLYNTSDNHKVIAEAIQHQWKENLNIEVALFNVESKVYYGKRRQKDFQICRFGWVGDYLDPDTFLNMWVTDGGNNAAGWSNPEYDALIKQATATTDQAARFELFQQAEAILLEAMPIMPINFDTTVNLVNPAVKNWHSNILDHHPYKTVYLAP